MENLRVLLVGGAGYIGSHCALALRDAGVETFIYDDLSTGYAEAAMGHLIVGDVRDRAHLESVLRNNNIHAVMHFAARLDVGESVTRPLEYFDINVAGTLSLLTAMAAADVRLLVFSSTCAIYGNPDYLPLDELHPRRPVSPYGQSKLMVEDILQACREREGFRVTTLRYFNACGGDPDGRIGESHRPEKHLIPLALEAACGERTLTIFGRDYPTPDGTCVRDYIHVLDLAEAHRLALQRLLSGDKGSAYNLGTGTGSSVLEIIEAVERVTGRTVSRVDGPRRAGDPEGLYAASEKVTRELNWRPRFQDLDVIVQTAWHWHQHRRY